MSVKVGSTVAAAVVSAALLFGSVAMATELPPDAIGEVKELESDARFLRDGDAVAAERGGAVFSGDTVSTGDDGAIGITFIDGTILSLGPDSELVIDEMVYDPEGGDLGFTMQVLRGTAGYLSGRIAALAPETVAITTPTSTIGIRGTRLLIRVSD
jgi:hypothetical protein